VAVKLPTFSFLTGTKSAGPAEAKIFSRVRHKNAAGATLKSYAYNGLHRRVQESAGGVTTDFYSSSWQVLEERVGGNTIVQYVWSPVYVDAMVLRDRDTDGDGTLDERLWVVQDANFNVTALVDSSGEVVERYVYDPFGRVTVLDAEWNVRPGDSAYDWLYLHQGGRYDVTSGLYHFRFRDYSPTLGRWTSLDPLSYTAGDVNLYRTVGNNPLHSLDPNGLDRIDQIEVQGQVKTVWYVDERLFRDDPRHYVGRLVIVNGEQFVCRRVGEQEYYVPLAKVEELTSYWSWEPTERSEWDNWFIQNGVNLWEPSARNLSIQMGVHGFTGYNDLAKAQAEIRGWAEIGMWNNALPPLPRIANPFTISPRAVGTRPLTPSVAATVVQTRGVSTTQITQILEAIAQRAQTTVGLGRGPIHGTKVHAAFAREVEALGRSDLFSEVSYLNGNIVRRGTPGSIRVDIVYGPSRETPMAIYDLKTGQAKLTSKRVAEIRRHLPPGYQDIPIIEIRIKP
jgi:RHS repeat-associated protein